MTDFQELSLITLLNSISILIIVFWMLYDALLGQRKEKQ